MFFDNLDQLITTSQYLTDTEINITRFEYDGSQNRTKIIDAEEKQTNYVYDERGLLYTVTDAENNITTYSYDENGNLKEIEDAKTNSTFYEYDDFNRLIKTIYPDTSFEQFSYDKNSNLKTKRTRKGDTIQYNYDELNRIKTKTYPNSTAVNYSYDIASRLMSVTSHTSQVTSYDYDNLNRVINVHSVFGSLSSDIGYSYDQLGNRTKLIYPDNIYITYEYDQLNRLKRLMADGSSLIAEYTYDELSRRTQLDYANTTQTTYQYDDLNRLTDIGRTQGAPLHYGYDKVGNRTSMTVNGTDTHNYTYDNIYQLTNVDYPATSTFSDTNYNYDDLGNRESVVDSATTSYTSNELNQYTNIGLDPITHDLNGNLINDSTWTHTYDYENRLISSTDGTTNVTYSYDSFGRRIHKSVIGSLSSDIWYLYDGDQVIVEYDGSNQQLRKYVYGTGIDEPIQVTRYTTQDTFYYHFDGLGSVVALTDSSGATVESYEYDVYGNTIIRDAQDAILNTSALGNSYGFTGRRLDSETGLYYYRARYYDPVMGRFLQTDPIGYYGGINLYSYVSNNPLNFVDPMGLCGESANPWGLGWGLNLADLLDFAIANAELYYTQDPMAWQFNTFVSTVGDFLNGTTNLLRLGEGWAAAEQYASQRNYWMATASVCEDVSRAATIFAVCYSVAQTVRPFYQYYPEGSPGYSSQYMTRGQGWSKPYKPGPDAYNALRLDQARSPNPGNAVRQVQIGSFEVIRGPQRVPGGTGIEYYRGVQWP